jgi:tetratricopeptide (TPR) repeat protein
VRAAGAALLLALAVLVPHWPGSRAEFAYDDRDFIQVNQSLRDAEGAFGGWLAPFPPDQPERGLYRPLTALSYALDLALGGGDARTFHRSNVLLYGIVVALVYRLALAYGRSQGFALALALLFAAHPVHCDAVDAIAGRSELLALLFCLIALLAYLRTLRPAGAGRAPRTGVWLATSAAAYALACASKETAAVLPAILAVHAWVAVVPGSHVLDRRASLARLAPHALVLVVYLVARVAALGGFAPSEPLLRGVPFEQRLYTLGSVFLEDLRLLVFPRVLQIDFYYQQAIGIASGASARALAGLVAFCALVATLAWLLWREGFAREPRSAGRAPQRALAACALAIFLGFPFPVSHLLDFGALMAERFLFAPSLGFVLFAALAGAAALDRALPDATLRRAAAGLLVGLLALAGSLRSADRAAEWRDAAALWVSADRALPDNPAILSNLASVRIDRGELEEAVRLLERSLARDPKLIEALGNLGNVRLAQGRLEEARAAYERLLALAPDDFITWSNLGVLETRRGRLADAVPLFQRALEINPNYADAQRNLAATLERLEAERAGRPAPAPQGST